MQVSLYENIRRVYGYECERLDIDITSTYFEGDECILAEFGHPRGHTKDKTHVIMDMLISKKNLKWSNKQVSSLLPVPCRTPVC
jgi:hypothetical protein